MIVLDAAALVDAVLDRPSKAWILDQLAAQQVCAPAHQPAEVLSALGRLQRAGEISRDVARASLAEAHALAQEFVLPSAAHLARALDLQDRLRVLDGLYVALAEDRACPLVTTDMRLARADPPCEVRAPRGGDET